MVEGTSSRPVSAHAAPRAFAQSAELTLHAHLRYGRSPHHICEATFKALANALGAACALTGRDEVPSTKGTLSG